jgi:hypothetical protein
MQCVTRGYLGAGVQPSDDGLRAEPGIDGAPASGRRAPRPHSLPRTTLVRGAVVRPHATAAIARDSLP